MASKKIKGLVKLDEYNSKNIRAIQNLFSQEELITLKNVKHGSVDIWSEFTYFHNMELVKLILNKMNGDTLTL
jgi:hypothetical protein